MDYIKFTIEVAEKNHSISAGMAKEQYDTLRAERDEAVRLLTAINEIGKRDLSNQKYDGYFESIREFLAKVKP